MAAWGGMGCWRAIWKIGGIVDEWYMGGKLGGAGVGGVCYIDERVRGGGIGCWIGREAIEQSQQREAMD